MRNLTVGGFIDFLRAFDPDAPCCGTFWLAEDFLSLDDSLTPEEVTAVMELADDRHDAGVLYNWDFLQSIVDDIIAERE